MYVYLGIWDIYENHLEDLLKYRLLGIIAKNFQSVNIGLVSRINISNKFPTDGDGKDVMMMIMLVQRSPSVIKLFSVKDKIINILGL